MVRKGVVVSVGLVLVVAVVILGDFLFFESSLPEGYYEVNLSEEAKGKIEESVNEMLLGLRAMYASVELLQDSEIISEEELEVSLPRGTDYDDSMILNRTRKLVVECEECDKREECNFVCGQVCPEKNMAFVDILPPFDLELEKEGECSCLYKFLSHINSLRFVQSIKNKDADECGKIEFDVGDSVIKKANCYMSSAILLQDESICEKIISNDVAKNECYFRFAVFKKDINLCLNVINDETLEWSKSSCEGNISVGEVLWYVVPE